ncbi:MAG TPA: ATP-binding protein [Xanthobacteraceae bacterium]|jgi:serine/threonine-protein kinase RsbW
MASSRTTPARRRVLRPDLAELGPLTQWAGEFAEQAGLPQSLSFALQLCLEEAAANIIMYSGAAETGQEIAIELMEAAPDVLAIIEDGGRPFDPTSVPPPPEPASIAQAPIGQLGVHFMRSFASEMRYEQRDGRNRLTLRFNPADVAAKASE